MGYTKVDNWLFDVVMPAASANTFRIVAVVIRKTAGWNQEKARISWNDFQEKSNIKSRATIQKAIDEAIANGWIDREQDGQWFNYWVRSGSFFEPLHPKSGIEIEPLDPETGSENEPVSGSKNEPPSIIKDNIKTLADNFTRITAIMPGRSQWEDDWENPLNHLLEIHGDIESTTGIMQRAYDFARDGPKTYTITCPRSLITIIANLPSDNGHKPGTIRISSR